MLTQKLVITKATNLAFAVDHERLPELRFSIMRVKIRGFSHFDNLMSWDEDLQIIWKCLRLQI